MDIQGIKNFVGIKNFIVFEGIDGSGKTTQAQKLIQKFNSVIKPPFTALYTKEPTNNEIGQLIRLVLAGHLGMCDKALRELFIADRMEHLYGKGGIVELCKKCIVVCDRYSFSGQAYNKNTLESMQRTPVFPLPQVIVYLQVDAKCVDKTLARVAKRKGTPEIFENVQKQQSAAHNYDWVISPYKQLTSVITIDALQDEDKIAQDIWEQVSPIILQ